MKLEGDTMKNGPMKYHRSFRAFKRKMVSFVSNVSSYAERIFKQVYKAPRSTVMTPRVKLL